jgi:hypothetical protein
MARVDMFVREDSEVLVNELKHDPRVHLDERLREAVRGFRCRIRRPARAAARARDRAARAPAEPALLVV